MSLKPPLANRRDVQIYTFNADGEHDPDVMLERVRADIVKYEHSGFFVYGSSPLPGAVPVVRAVPLTEQEVYEDAVRLVCERLRAQDAESAPEPAGVALVVAKTGKDRAPVRQAVRVLQNLYS